MESSIETSCGLGIQQAYKKKMVYIYHTYVEGSLGGKKITWAKVFKLCYYEMVTYDSLVVLFQYYEFWVQFMS